jgi:hypothetical protein
VAIPLAGQTPGAAAAVVSRRCRTTDAGLTCAARPLLLVARLNSPQTMQMNRMNSYLKLQWTGAGMAALCALVLVAGCKTVPYKKGEAASASLNAASMAVHRESHAISNCVQALDGLMNGPAGDLPAQYTLYAAAVDRFVTANKQVASARLDTQKKGAAYLAAWDAELAQMNYELVRNQSQARREKVGRSLTSLNQRFEEAAEASGPLVTYLGDLRKALGSDLTRGGLDSVKSIAENARKNADNVLHALQGVETELKSLSQQLSTGASQ